MRLLCFPCDPNDCRNETERESRDASIFDLNRGLSSPPPLDWLISSINRCSEFAQPLNYATDLKFLNSNLSAHFPPILPLSHLIIAFRGLYSHLTLKVAAYPSSKSYVYIYTRYVNVLVNELMAFPGPRLVPTHHHPVAYN